MEKLLFTSESVTEGHPDKICDQVSDAILDAMLAQDPMSRVACETLTNTGFVMIMGEITTKANVDITQIVRDTICEIGYTDSKMGFDGNSCAVMVALDKQSPDIAMGVDKALEAREGDLEDDLDTGAGDQGMMFGFATNETEEYMPYPIALAHKLSRRLTEVRKNGTLPYLRPDGKTQVTVEYDESGKPIHLNAVVLSTQHDENVTQEQIHEDMKKQVFEPVLPKELVDEKDCPGGGRARGSLNSQPLQVTLKSNACSLNSCGIRCKDGGVVVRGSGCRKGWGEEQACVGGGVGGWFAERCAHLVPKGPCGGPPMMSSTGL